MTTFIELPEEQNPLGNREFDVGGHSAPAFADIDGDGDLDAFVGQFSALSGTTRDSSDIEYLRNDDGIFTQIEGSDNPLDDIQLNDLYGKPAFADIDEDGDLDAFIGNASGNIEYFQNNGDGNLEAIVGQRSGLFRTFTTDIPAPTTENQPNPIEPSPIKDFGTSLVGEQAAVETGNINDDNNSDIYALSVVSGEVIDVTLSGLTNDADLRVVQDLNSDGVIDDDEIYAISENVETNSESISLNEQGDYLVEVYQFEGSTDYTLQFDQESVTNEPVPGEGDTVYRFFETNGQTQFYTTSEVERDSVIANLPNYEYEDESFIGAPDPGVNDITGVTPVYRLFNTSTGVHLYTASEVERDLVVENLSNYISEGISYYGYESQQEGTVPLYRFYNQSLDAHFYTPSATERDEFIASPEYQPEGSESGIAFYVQPVEI